MAIVCSARSGSTKALGTTNLLLKAASEALSRSAAPSNQATPGIHSPFRAQSPVSFSPSLSPVPQRSAGLSLSCPAVDLIQSEHLTAARALIRDQKLLKELEQEIETDCEGLRTFLHAAQVIDEISPRSKDSIMGTGERIACKLIAAALRDRVSLLFTILLIGLRSSKTGYRQRVCLIGEHYTPTEGSRWYRPRWE